ncbi:MAG: ribbon-helix-helix protein, CopG family [Thermodesulfobacteriota bacterium]
MRASTSVDRITVSLPHSLAGAVEALRKELKVSRSDLYRMALERFIEEQKRSRLSAIAAEMAEEYASNQELTVLCALDGEDFA